MKKLIILKFIALLLPAIMLPAGCDSPIERARDFVPNRAPEIFNFYCEYPDGVSHLILIPNIDLPLTVVAGDPDGDPVQYRFSSVLGSFRDQEITSSGCTIVFRLNAIAGGQEAHVTVTVIDGKGAEATETLNLGSGKRGPVLTLQNSNGLKKYIKEDGNISLQFSSDSDGIYQVRVMDDVSATPDFDKTLPCYFYEVGDDIRTVTIDGPDASGGSVHLNPEAQSPDKVWIIFQDYLKQRASLNYEIIVDSTPPKGNITINDNRGYTNQSAVTLTLSASDNALADMMIADNNSFTGKSWVPYNSTLSWTLPSSDDELKTVYIKFRDACENESETYSASIRLDKVAPEIIETRFNRPTADHPYWFSIVDNDEQLRVTVKEKSRVTGTIAGSIGPGSASIEPHAAPDGECDVIFTPTSAWNVSANGNSPHYVHMTFTDEAGNSSSISFNCSVFHAVKFVRLNASVTPNGSRFYPYGSIGAGISAADAAVSGNQTAAVIISQGLYVTTDTPISLPPYVSLYGGYSDDFYSRNIDQYRTIVRNNDTTPTCITLTGVYTGETIIDGLYVDTGGRSKSNVGILMNLSGSNGPIVQNCVIRGRGDATVQSISVSSGIVVTGGKPRIQNNIISIISNGGFILSNSISTNNSVPFIRNNLVIADGIMSNGIELAVNTPEDVSFFIDNNIIYLPNSGGGLNYAFSFPSIESSREPLALRGNIFITPSDTLACENCEGYLDDIVGPYSTLTGEDGLETRLNHGSEAYDRPAHNNFHFETIPTVTFVNLQSDVFNGDFHIARGAYDIFKYGGINGSRYNFEYQWDRDGAQRTAENVWDYRIGWSVGPYDLYEGCSINCPR